MSVEDKMYCSCIMDFAVYTYTAKSYLDTNAYLSYVSITYLEKKLLKHMAYINDLFVEYLIKL